jgi:hypothetical protein
MVTDGVIACILRSNLFWYEFLRLILLLIVPAPEQFERKSTSSLMNFLVYSFEKASSGTTFL